MVKLEMISGPSQAILFTVITWNPESNCIFVPLKHIDVTKFTSTTLDVMLEKISTLIGTLMETENCQIRGQVLQGSLYWMKNHPMDIPCPGRDWQESKRPPDQTLCGQRLGKVCRKRRNAKKSKSGLSKNRGVKMLRGIYFIYPAEEEFKDIMKNARRKMEIPTPAAMLCKTPVNCRGETSRSNGNYNTKYACIVDADESVRIRLEGVPQRFHAELLQFGTQVSSDASSIENTRCKGSSGKRRIYTSNRRWTNQNPWRRSGPENIHLGTASTNARRKSPRVSWRIRRVSSTTSRLVTGCWWSDKWILVHVRKLHVPPSWNPESNFTRREESFTIPLKYIDVTRATCTSLDVVLEKISTITLMESENCQIRGHVLQGSRNWMKNHPMDIHGSERDWWESNRHLEQTLCGQKFGKTCQKRRIAKECKKWAI